MNQPSDFQAQYPLSPKKFWKKIIPSLIGNFIFSLFIGAFVGFLYVRFINTAGWVSDIFPFKLWFLSSIFATIALFIIIVFVKSWYIKVYIKRYYYDCGDQFITIKKGVFAPTEIHIQFQKIQDVYVDQDIPDRLMGLYDVHIASATVTSGIEAHIDGVNADVAENLKNIILAKINGSSSSLTSPQTPMPQFQQSSSTPVQFNQKISSETYPISGSWFVSALVSSFVLSIFLVVFFAGFILTSPSFGFWWVPVLFFVFIFFISMIYFSIWKKNFYFEFTPDYILLRTGVISRSENHLPYKSIQDILNNQGIVDRIFGLSTVTIQNAAQQMMQNSRRSIGSGSGISLVWQPKEKAEELTKTLNDIVSKINPQNQNNNTGL